MEHFHFLQEIIVSIRNIRADMKLDPKKRVAAEIFAWDQLTRETIERNLDGVLRLGLLSELKISSEPFAQPGGAVRSTSQYEVRIAYAEVVDPEAEKVRLKKELDGLQKAISSKESQLGNDTFRSRAPEKIIRGLEATLAEQRIEMQKIVERLGQL
jgi:valyl-tRNA synthetase